MIRVGIGGWTYEPWRGTFYRPGLKHAAELAHASRQVTTIEINGTFYRTQSAASFAKTSRSPVSASPFLPSERAPQVRINGSFSDVTSEIARSPI